MVKSEVIKEIAKRTNETQKSVEAVLNGLSEIVIECLTNKNERIPITNLGAFKVKEVKERKGTSKLTGKPWVKPAHYERIFKFSPDLKIREIE